MALTYVYIGEEKDDGTGNHLRDSFNKINSNVQYLYNLVEGLQTQLSQTNSNLNAKLNSNSPIESGTGTKITFDTKGLVTSATTLSSVDIPSLHANKITVGEFDDQRISESSVLQYQHLLSIEEAQISDLQTYAPLSHSHSTSQISGLQGILNGLQNHLNNLPIVYTARVESGSYIIPSGWLGTSEVLSSGDYSGWFSHSITHDLGEENVTVTASPVNTEVAGEEEDILPSVIITEITLDSFSVVTNVETDLHIIVVVN